MICSSDIRILRLFSVCECNEEIAQILIDNGAIHGAIQTEDPFRWCPRLLSYDISAGCNGIYGKVGNKTIHLENEVKNVYGEQVEGFYILQSNMVNGKHYWAHENGTSALWMYKDVSIRWNNDFWIIGNKEDLGSSKGYMYLSLIHI